MKTDELAATLKRLRLFGCWPGSNRSATSPGSPRCSPSRPKRRRAAAWRIARTRRHWALQAGHRLRLKWPRKIDRVLVEDLFSLGFVTEGVNVVLLGPNGVGKTMLYATSPTAP
ncbi:MAG: ATP-binding protein [Byssovorax sp.]